VQQHHGRIDLRDMDRAVEKKTKLIEIPLVSMVNGFQHDLKAVCDLAHAHGAYVYADAMQAAGAAPIDVWESNLDFCMLQLQVVDGRLRARFSVCEGIASRSDVGVSAVRL